MSHSPGRGRRARRVAPKTLAGASRTRRPQVFLALLAALAFLGLAMAQSVASRRGACADRSVTCLRLRSRFAPRWMWWRSPWWSATASTGAVAGLTRNDFEVYGHRGQADHHGLLEQHFTSQAERRQRHQGGHRCGRARGAAGPKSEPRPRYVALCFGRSEHGPARLEAGQGSGGNGSSKPALVPGDRVAVATGRSRRTRVHRGRAKLVERIAKGDQPPENQRRIGAAVPPRPALWRHT